RQPHEDSLAEVVGLSGRQPRELALNLDAGLKGWLLVGRGVLQAVVGIAARDDPHLRPPVPGGAEGDDLRLDRGRVERAATALGPALAVHVTGATRWKPLLRHPDRPAGGRFGIRIDPFRLSPGAHRDR